MTSQDVRDWLIAAVAAVVLLRMLRRPRVPAPSEVRRAAEKRRLRRRRQSARWQRQQQRRRRQQWERRRPRPVATPAAEEQDMDRWTDADTAAVFHGPAGDEAALAKLKAIAKDIIDNPDGPPAGK